MNIKEQHVVSGMVTDMNVSRFDPTKVLYARNIRITQMEGNQGLLCVTNEKGTRQCSVTGDNVVGAVIGSAVINDYLVLFTTDNDTSSQPSNPPYTDCIYRLEKSSNANYDFQSVRLFSGNLGFSTEHPLETLPLFENNLIQKVYWVDGEHQLRCINIADTSQRPNKVSSTSGESTVFDANPTINLSHSISVTKRTDGGEFPAGTIQYAFTYYSLNGPETNVFETTPLYELSPKTKGIAADGRTNCSFRISLSNLDTSFEYIRVYAIIRTSKNATPSVRIIGNYEVSSNLTVVDNGSVGSSVDATSLLFIGGEPVAPSTFTSKDNTLFLGNIKLLRPSIGNISVDNMSIADKFRSLITGGNVPLSNVSTPNELGVGSGDWFYDYTIDNNRPSTSLRRFKRGETYRLGIVAQHETGIWSDVVWIGDYENTIVPQFYKKIQSAGMFKLGKGSGSSSITGILNALVEAGFVRIAPVVVYPEGSDRTVFCQGLVSATVYNVEDRFSNHPYSQASWFFRPIAEGLGVAAFPHCSLYPTGPTLEFKGFAELQLNDSPRNFLPQVEGYWGSSSSSKSRIPATDMLAMFGNDYYVDTSIVTLNSPDIELDDSLQQEDFDGLHFRVVGVAKTGTQNIVAHTYADITAGPTAKCSFIDMALSRVNYIDSINTYLMSNYPSFPGYLYNVDRRLANFPVNLNIPFILYPWHKTGSILGKYNSTIPEELKEEFETAKLNNKILSSLWFAHTELFSTITNVSTDNIKLFDDTQSDFIPLGETADSHVYYGNVDSVRMYKNDSLSETNSSHYREDFNMLSPDISGSHQATFNQVTRTPHTEDRYGLILSMPFIGEDSMAVQGIAKGSLEDIMLKYGYFRVDNIGTSTWKFYDDAAVPIKYKSTKHAVIPLAHATYEIPSLYRCESLFTQYNGSSGQTTVVYPFWDETHGYTMSEGKVPFATEWPESFLYHDTWGYPRDSYKSYTPEIPTLYIGELYRTVDASTRFGGNTDESIKNNVWKKCGEAIKINSIISGSSTYLEFTEGDTYLARYDCLKTYPYADKDTNSIVEIFSTDLETRVNLDERYDNARGLMDNTLINPTNINLVNRLGFEQENNFLTFSSSDLVRENIDRFPNTMSITLEKTLGEEVDSWLQTTMTNTYDADGVYGSIEALKTFNDNVFVFQDNAFGQVLFNSRVQIPTSDGQPIEITNGMKFQGIRYLSNKIGCSNKWSIAISNSKMYWFDSGTADIWSFGGQGIDNLSTRLGVKGWVSKFPITRWSVADMGGLRTLHDEKYNDLYFMVGDQTNESYGSLLYSESLDTFVSVMDYTNLEQMYNLDGRTFVVPKIGIHAMWEGNYNSFFGANKPYLLRFIANSQPTMHKVFDTVQWRSDTWNASGKYLPNETFKKLTVWNQYQKTHETSLTNTPGKPSPLKKKFNTFRALVPRDKEGNSLTVTDMRYKGISRIRGNYAVVELKHDEDNTNKMQFYDLEISEFL